MDDFFVTCGFDTLTIIHNTAQAVGKFAVCGTRGWFFDAEADEDKKVLNREVGRLGASLDAAEKIGGEPVVFLHYPPVCGGQSCPEILSVLQERRLPAAITDTFMVRHPPRLSGTITVFADSFGGLWVLFPCW